MQCAHQIQDTFISALVAGDDELFRGTESIVLCNYISHFEKKNVIPKFQTHIRPGSQIKLFDWNGRRIFTIYSGTRHEQYTHTHTHKS